MSEHVIIVNRQKNVPVKFVKCVRAGLTRWIYGKYEFTYYLNECMPEKLLDNMLRMDPVSLKKDEVICWIDDHELQRKKHYVIEQRDYMTTRYYTGRKGKRGIPIFSSNIRRAYVSYSETDIKNTLETLRKEANYAPMMIREIYLKEDNKLMNMKFLIFCRDKRNGKYYYMRQYMKDGIFKTCRTSDMAQHMGYDEALHIFDLLSANNKEFLYTMVADPHKSINADNQLEYEHQRKLYMVNVGFTMDELNKKAERWDRFMKRLKRVFKGRKTGK